MPGRRVGTKPGPSSCFRTAPEGRPCPESRRGPTTASHQGPLPVPALCPPAASRLLLSGAALGRPPSCQLLPLVWDTGSCQLADTQRLESSALLTVREPGRSRRVRGSPPLLHVLLAGGGLGPGELGTRAHRPVRPRRRACRGQQGSSLVSPGSLSSLPWREVNVGAVLLLASEPREAGAPPAATHVTAPPPRPRTGRGPGPPPGEGSMVAALTASVPR